MPLDMQLDSAKKVQGQPGARAAAFGLLAPSPAHGRCAGQPRSAPPAPATAGRRWLVRRRARQTAHSLYAKSDDGRGGRARHASQARCRPGEVSVAALLLLSFFGVGSRRRPRRMTKVYIQRTFRKPRKNQANEEKSDVRARRRGTSAPSPAGTARRQPAPAPWPPPAPRTTRGASARRSAAVSSPAGRR